MSATKKALEFVDIKSKDTVYGYIRIESKSYNYNIPIPIINLFLLYYYESDNWDKKCIGPSLTIDDNNCLKYEGEFSASMTAFLQKELCGNSKLTHCWKFKIKNVWIDTEDDDTWTTTIGLFPIPDDNKPKDVVDSAFVLHGGCGFCVQMGRLVNYSFDKHFDKYGKRCVENDIIKMIVDCDKGEMKYIINGMDYGTAFNIDPTKKYRAAVNLFKPGDCIQLL